MHKEIRAGHQDAIHWAKIYAHTTSWDSLNNYLFKIIFEETRNLSLWKFCKTNIFIEDKLLLTKYLLASKKKWELKCLRDHMQNLCNGFSRMKEVNDLELVKNKYDVYSYLFYIHANRRMNMEGYAGKNQLIEFVFDKLRSINTNTELRSYLNLNPGRTFYELMIALELKENLLDLNECTDPYIGEDKFDLPELCIPALKEYYFDIHTYKGMHKTKKIFPELRKGNLGALEHSDLQYSGMIISTYYRFHVSGKYGARAISNNKGFWKELSDIESYLALDEYFYSKLLILR